MNFKWPIKNVGEKGLKEPEDASENVRWRQPSRQELSVNKGRGCLTNLQLCHLTILTCKPSNQKTQAIFFFVLTRETSSAL